jgi:hypothetical protein
MNYLDKVFYLQYPFYHLPDTQGRGWLFSILRRVKSAFHAVLALSEQHLNSSRPRNSDITTRLVCLRAEGSHHDLALREMLLSIRESHTWNESMLLVRSLEALTCILQLLFGGYVNCHLVSSPDADLLITKIFAGGKENWQTHLRTAASLILALVQARIAQPGSLCPNFTS